MKNLYKEEKDEFIYNIRVYFLQRRSCIGFRITNQIIRQEKETYFWEFLDRKGKDIRKKGMKGKIKKKGIKRDK